MNRRALALILCFAGSAGSLSAQFGWYVDPVGGDDGNSGWNTGDAFLTLTFALTRAAAGEPIYCMPGTYSAGSGEIFPISLKNGVPISALGGVPVFDGGGTGLLFELGADVTQDTMLSGLSFTNAALLFTIQSGRTVDGLILLDCNFSDCATGFAAICSTNAAGQNFTLSGCTFAAIGGVTAISVTVSDGVLDGGGLIDNRILGSFATGVALLASDDAVIEPAFALQRNRIFGCDDGILLSAAGSGGNDLNVATISSDLTANHLDGSPGVGGVGLSMMAETGALGENALINCAVSLCTIADFGVAVRASSDNDGSNRADVTADFYGNSFSGAQIGVQVDAVQPDPQNRNADPNFGGHADGGFAGLNTFSGFATDFDLTPAQSADLAACCNWFDGAPVTQEGTALTQPILETPLEATVSGSPRPGFEGELVTLHAADRSGFVDSLLGGAIGQITVEVGSVALAQSALSAPPPGASLTISLPNLAAGLHQVTVTNPGGQTGIFEVLVEASASGDDNCFVATAAHGDANAPEVLALRGLRDEYLATTAPGRGFIRWYYREGPAAAAWIAERPWARAGVRAALQPAVLLSRALTQWHPGQRFGFAVLLLGAAFAVLRRRQGLTIAPA